MKSLPTTAPQPATATAASDLDEHMAAAPTQCKRSHSIDLRAMRKLFSAKPIAVGVSSILLAACGDDREDAHFFAGVEECQTRYPEHHAICQSAYADAVREAARTSPKYLDRVSCEHEFGVNQCISYGAGNGDWFMPFMAGYMVGGLFSNRHYSSPLFTSHSYRSPYRGKWMSADGYIHGDYRTKQKKVRQDAFKPKPVVARTIKRGGFGSTVRAKSSWGSSRGGWGG